MQSLTQFMKKELILYIKEEYEKGHQISKIKDSLLEGGHHKDLVKEAMSALTKNNFNIVKALEEPISSNLDQELYYDIVNSLVKYIEFHLKKGYSISKLKKILLDYGHSEEIIDQAIAQAGKSLPKNYWLAKSFEILMIIVTLFMIIFISGSTDEPIELIALSFSPTIFTIIATYVAIQSKIEFKYIWLFPLLFTGLFLALFQITPIVLEIEVVKICIINLALSIIFIYSKASSTFDQDKAIDVLEDEVQTDEDKETKK